MSQRNQDDLKYLYLTEVIYTCTHHSLYISDGIEQNREFDQMIAALRAAGGDDLLEIRLNSGGGDVSIGQKLIALMHEIFRGRSITVMDAEASSMAAMVFLAGDKRVVYEHSMCMLHNYSMGMYGKGGEVGDRYAATNGSMISYLKLAIEPFVKKGEFKRILDGKDLYLDAYQMCKRGAATHIIVAGKEIEAAEYVKNVKN
jgi:ATP-dependent protease ClpP protease subunit